MSATVAKACTYAGTLGASGMIFFLTAQARNLRQSSLPLLRRAFAAALELALLASVVRMVATLAAMRGELRGALDPSLAGIYLHTAEGPAAVARLAGLVAMGSALLPTTAPSLKPNPLAWAGALAAATSFAWVGHAHALGTLASTVVALHLLCVAFWWGALPSLLIVAAGDDPAITGAVAARFGKIAVWVVGLLLAAGTLLLCLLLDDVTALWRSAYGRMVVLKLALVAVLFAAAAYNKLSLTPRLRRGDPSAMRALRTSIGAEMALLLGIFLVTAVFTTLFGPHGE